MPCRVFETVCDVLSPLKVSKGVGGSAHLKTMDALNGIRQASEDTHRVAAGDLGGWPMTERRDVALNRPPDGFPEGANSQTESKPVKPTASVPSIKEKF